jgi:hypothetical protein
MLYTLPTPIWTKPFKKSEVGHSLHYKLLECSAHGRHAEISFDFTPVEFTPMQIEKKAHGKSVRVELEY